MKLIISLLAATIFLAFIAAAQPAAPTPGVDVRYRIPAEDAALPGAGPLRRADWFQQLWTQRRSAWAERVQEDQHALVFLGDSITQGRTGFATSPLPTENVVSLRNAIQAPDVLKPS